MDTATAAGIGRGNPDIVRDLYNALEAEHLTRQWIDQFMDDFAADEHGGHPQLKALAGMIDSREKAHIVAHYIGALTKMGYKRTADIRQAMILAVAIWSGARVHVGTGAGGALGFMEMVNKTYPKVRPFLNRIAATPLAQNAGTLGKTFSKGVSKVPGPIGMYTAIFESYQATRTGDWGVALGELAKLVVAKAFPYLAALDAIQNIIDYLAPNSPELHKGIAMMKAINPLAWVGTDVDFVVSVFSASLELVLYGQAQPDIAAQRIQRFMDRVAAGGHSAAMSELGYSLGYNSINDWKQVARKIIAGGPTINAIPHGVGRHIY